MKNMKPIIWITLLLSVFAIGNTACSKKPVDEPVIPTAVSYTPDNTIFANPERGFYKYTECRGNGQVL
jgi:hypothetical protein